LAKVTTIEKIAVTSYALNYNRLQNKVTAIILLPSPFIG
jgi:hypothetical protein